MRTTLWTLTGLSLFVLSLPYWLPSLVLALRMRIFARINSSGRSGGPDDGEGIPIPGGLVDASRFKQVYAHQAADGRSLGAVLSDLFWYWLSPGPEMHQEHLEPGVRYEEVARATRRILAVPRQTAEDRTEDVWRSIVQLVLGTYMVWDARRLRLCERHFEAQGSE